ncbi:MAG: 30S ribosomal protein S8 [Acidimicrobiales bacterium]
MTMTDRVADMLTRLRNGATAAQDTVRMPTSKLKEALAGILRREGYIADFKVTTDGARPGRVLEITMKYTAERAPTISGLKRISKPGLRVYIKADRLPRVLGGLGVAVLSTSQGLMTDREARDRRVGGEILCYVW